MAEKYLLQVTAGPSYDLTQHQVVPVNSPKPLAIESELISVDLNVRIQAYQGLPLSSPSTSSYFNLPHHVKDDDQYSISFAFSLKSAIKGNDLVFGNDFENPIRDRLPPGFNTAFRIMKWFIDPGLEGDVYADKPYLYGPLGSSINTLYIGSMEHKYLGKNNGDPNAGLLFTEGGCDEGIVLRKSKEIPDTEVGRKKYFLNRKNQSSWWWEAGREYGCDFFNPYLDFNAFALRLPGFNLSMIKYLDGQATRSVVPQLFRSFYVLTETLLTVTHHRNLKDKDSNIIIPKRSHTLRYTLKNRATDTVLLVVMFTLYLKEDIDEQGALKEGLLTQMS
ncbi:hypothetical protein EPUL_005850 [Erysiphe pulchra]|uniref:Domain of unknown function at the cortex 1 domain-containing protein n=1 Tax=Erysiphe pulchra TaxID=225359 RepID=A0A2S4PL75_9PEZI|nr:hypothetical protein EPUL_005850 [Erysiphe pulchra]